MNVLCLDQFSELGGAQRCLLDLLPAFADRGWTAHVAAPGNGPLAERAMASRATADRIPCGSYNSGRKTAGDMARFALETPQLARRIGALIRRHDAGLVYVNAPRLLPAAALAARWGPPLLFHTHSYLEGYVRRIAGWSLRMARAAVVASCRFVAWPLLPYCGDRGVRVVYNGVAAGGRPRGPLPEGRREADFRIGVIGRIAPEKGQADFLRAARLLHRDVPRCRFLICGAPLFSDPGALRYRSELEALAENLPVEFTGWKENVEGVLASLDLLIVPSAPVDATPRVILEAFAAGVPVVAFASGGIPEIVEHNVTGFLVERRSPLELASALRHLLLREPHRLCEVARRALAKVREDFSLERYRRQMLETIEAALRS
jgi:glycosyltransferase involved in cell wall biosynthesis